jgi:hypothetical protein
MSNIIRCASLGRPKTLSILFDWNEDSLVPHTFATDGLASMSSPAYPVSIDAKAFHQLSSSLLGRKKKAATTLAEAVDFMIIYP